MSDNKADSMELDFDVYSQLYTQQKLRWISARTNPELESVVNRLGAQSAKVGSLSDPMLILRGLYNSRLEVCHVQSLHSIDWSIAIKNKACLLFGFEAKMLHTSMLSVHR